MRVKGKKIMGGERESGTLVWQVTRSEDGASVTIMV